MTDWFIVRALQRGNEQNPHIMRAKEIRMTPKGVKPQNSYQEPTSFWKRIF